LVAGEDLVAQEAAAREESEQAAAEAADVSLDAVGLESAWGHDGDFTSIATAEASGAIYALRSDSIDVFDAAGAAQGEIPIDDSGRELRVTQLDDDPAIEFLLFQQWGGDLRAVDDDGGELWTYPAGQGIDDVWPTDLDGDGVNETIVGYNGAGGVHVVDSRGEQTAENGSIGNVWHVAAGRFTADEMQVVTTSAAGEVHVFSTGGEAIADFPVGLYANYIRLTPTIDGQRSRAVVSGTADAGEAIVLIDGEGAIAWTTSLPTLGEDHVDSLSIDSRGAHAIVGMRGGLVHVVDLASGKIVASVGRMGRSPSVGLLDREDAPPLAVVATGARLEAFTLTGEPAAEGEVEVESD
jgi:hypothetical protein